MHSIALFSIESKYYKFNPEIPKFLRPVEVNKVNRETGYWNWKRSPLSACIVLGSLALAVIFLGNPPAVAQQSSASVQQGRQLALKQQLTLGLKATTAKDKAFIDTVVAKVNQGTLPRKLVDSTFLWARRRAQEHSESRALRPIIYFQPGLIARAKRLGIQI